MGWMAWARRRVAEKHSERPRKWTLFAWTAEAMVETMVSTGTLPLKRWLDKLTGGRDFSG